MSVHFHTADPRSASVPTVCIVSSPGGHLAEVRALRDAYANYRYFFVVNEALRFLPPDMAGCTYVIRHAERDLGVFVNFVEAWRILRRERPALILSAGASPAFPFAVVGKLLSIPTIYIETVARVHSPSLTGRLMYPVADQFYYQWPELAKWFPRGIYAGALLDAESDS